MRVLLCTSHANQVTLVHLLQLQVSDDALDQCNEHDVVSGCRVLRNLIT
jgi:hypothetical protein